MDLETGEAEHSNEMLFSFRIKNTICGSHLIGVLLGAATLKWVRYEQSSECLEISDSSEKKET
ncbi:hypothetical protein DFH11DRAFT_1589780 [Phellopilus nigrolimitatus]|nr:hypothetical protein DFH11DRAFT_1589780 [Phellopilus nigrolimitatus]